jgi:Outer membrane protein beta-barrel domain
LQTGSVGVWRQLVRRHRTFKIRHAKFPLNTQQRIHMSYSRKTGAVAALFLGCALATPAFAANQGGKQAGGALFSYNYLQFSFVDLDSGLDGFKIDGSFDLNPNLALTASYMTTDNSSSFDYDLFALGLAYHQRLVDIPKSDIVLHGEFLSASLDHAHGSFTHSHDDDGLRLGAMLRYQAQQNIELFGDLSYTSIYDNDLALTAGVNLALNRQFSVVAAVELSDDDMLLLGIRMGLK